MIIIAISLFIVAILWIIYAIKTLCRRLTIVASRVASLEVSANRSNSNIDRHLQQATRLAISAGARCTKLESRADGITNRINALARYNSLRTKPTDTNS